MMKQARRGRKQSVSQVTGKALFLALMSPSGAWAVLHCRQQSGRVLSPDCTRGMKSFQRDVLYAAGTPARRNRFRSARANRFAG